MSSQAPKQPTKALWSARVLAILLVDALLWYGAFTWKAQDAREPLKVAVGLWPGSETLIMAREKGLLPTDDVRIMEMHWASAAMRALSSRVVDAAVLSLDEALRLADSGHDLRILLFMDTSIGADAVMAMPGARSIADLRGRRVGVEYSATGMYLLARALRTAGMTAADVKVFPVNMAETEDALLSGEVDAVVAAEPSLTRLRNSGAKSLYDSTQTPGEICRVLVARAEVVKDRGRELEELVSAHFEGMELIERKPPEPEMIVITRRQELSPEDFGAARKHIEAFDVKHNLRWLSGDTPESLATVRKVAEFMKGSGLISISPPGRDWLLPTFLEDRT